jgi:hypothetical protein
MSETQATAPPTPPNLSWSEETDAEAGRDFIGTIVKGEYPYHDEQAKFEGVQIRFLVRAEDPPYESLQPCWIPPSNKKGTKFVIWRNHLAKECPQAWRELLPKIQAEQDPAKQLNAFINGLVGMRFRFNDHQHPRANNPKEIVRMLCPIEYKGKGQVTEVQAEKIQL